MNNYEITYVVTGTDGSKTTSVGRWECPNISYAIDLYYNEGPEKLPSDIDVSRFEIIKVEKL